MTATPEKRIILLLKATKAPKAQKGKIMAKEKFTPELTQFLMEAYVDEVEKHGGEAKVTKEFNDLFFSHMRATEALANFTDPQLRGSLIISDVYVPHSPRVEPKKRGKMKAAWVAELSAFLPTKIAGGMKLTISDLEILVNAFQDLTDQSEDLTDPIEETPAA